MRTACFALALLLTPGSDLAGTVTIKDEFNGPSLDSAWTVGFTAPGWGSKNADGWTDSFSGAPSDGSAWTKGGKETDPYWPRGILRGGGWRHSAEFCWCSSRDAHDPRFRSDDVGFRPVFTLPEDE